MSQSRQHAHSDAGPQRDGRAVALFPPTGEMRGYTRFFTWLLGLASPRPGSLQRIVSGGMVTPTAHFANLSIDFQAYLFAVFHRRRLSRLTHAVLQPLTSIALAAALAAFRLHGPLLAGHRPLIFDLNGAWLAGLLFAAWYAAQGLLNGMALLAGVMSLFALGSAAAGTWILSLTRALASQGTGTRLALSPWFWVLVLSVLVMTSHAPEPLLPPRLSGRARWVRLPELFRRPDGGWRGAGEIVRSGLRVVFLGVIWGTVNELWAFWRLTPVSVLRGMWALGYQPERRARVTAAVKAAIDSGNPALDFIGIEGIKPMASAGRRRPVAP
jgi:hypothetical protein